MTRLQAQVKTVWNYKCNNPKCNFEEVATSGPTMIDLKCPECEKGIKQVQGTNAKIDWKMVEKIYNRLIQILDTYLDMDRGQIKIVALWIIGTYMFKQFSTFPRLFFNAIKGAGKTRLLKLLEALCWNGKIQVNLSEAVLFRTAGERTTLFDESEQMKSKDKQALRELLNSGYKRGGKIERMKKITGKEGESYEVESYDIFAPVALANINGLDSVLSDRTITLILEKSVNPAKVNLAEDFDTNRIILDVKQALQYAIECRVCSVELKKNIPPLDEAWNNYTLTTHSTHSTLYALQPLINDGKEECRVDILEGWQIELFEKVSQSGLVGRNLEIFFPLLYTSQRISSVELDDIIEIAKKIVSSKKADDAVENADISLYEYISKLDQEDHYYSVNEMAMGFADFYSFGDQDNMINRNWMGVALKRLNLVRDKKRSNKGIKVLLDIKKAKEKLLMFKEVKDEQA